MSQPQGPPQARAEPESPRVSEQLEQRAQEEQRVADNTAQKVTSTDLLGREVKEDIIGVDDNDEHKEGLRGIAEGLLAPTSQIAQMPKDIVQGVATEDQRMQTSWIDLLITPLLAPVMAAPQLGLTSRSYYNPLALAPRDAEWAQSLPEFLKQSEEPETRDFLTGMGDNVTALYEASTSSEVARLRDEGDVEKGITGWKQSGEEFMKYPGYYLASAVGELPYLVTPGTSAKIGTKVMATVVRITNKPTLNPSFLGATSKLDVAATKLNKVIRKERQEGEQPGRAIKDIDQSTVDNATDAFEGFTKTEIKTREKTIKMLEKEKKQPNLTKEETDFISETIRNEQSTITNRQAELILVKDTIKAAKLNLDDAKAAFKKVDKPDADKATRTEMENYNKAFSNYKQAKDTYLDKIGTTVSKRLDMTKKRSYEKIKTGYNAYRSQEIAKIELKVSKLKKERAGYIARKYGLNKTQQDELNKLQSRIKEPIGLTGKNIDDVTPSSPFAEGNLLPTASAFKLPDAQMPNVPLQTRANQSKKLQEVLDDIEMSDIIKRQGKTVLSEKKVPGQFGDDLIGYSPTKTTVRKSKIDKKIDKLEDKLMSLKDDADKLPAYESFAMTLEQLPYKSILPAKSAVAGAIVERNKKQVAVEETQEGWSKPTITFKDAPMTTADKIASIVKGPGESLKSLYNRTPQKIADMVQGHLVMKNRVYLQDRANPGVAIPVKVGVSESKFNEIMDRVRDLDKQIEKNPSNVGDLKAEKFDLWKDNKELLMDNSSDVHSKEFVPTVIKDESGKNIKIVDPQDMFTKPGSTPDLVIVDAAKPVVKVTEGGKKGEWNILMGYEDEVVKRSGGALVPDVVEGTAYLRPRKLLGSKYEFGRGPFDTLKGKEYFFTMTVPEDSILGAGLVHRGRQHTDSGPILITRGDDLTDDLIDLLVLEETPMKEAASESSYFIPRLTRRKDGKLSFSKKRRIDTAPKQYEGKTGYKMVDLQTFGSKYGDAWQRYAESNMTDISAGNVEVRYRGKNYGTIATIYRNRMLFQARGQESFEGPLAKLQSNKLNLLGEVQEEQLQISKINNELDLFQKPIDNKINELKAQIENRKIGIKKIDEDWTLSYSQKEQMRKRENKDLVIEERLLAAYTKYGGNFMPTKDEKFTGRTWAAMVEKKKVERARLQTAKEVREKIMDLQAQKDRGPEALVIGTKKHQKDREPEWWNVITKKEIDNTIDMAEMSFFADRDTKMRELNIMNTKMQIARNEKKITAKEFKEWDEQYTQSMLMYQDDQYITRASIEVIDSKIANTEKIIERLETQARDGKKYGMFDNDMEQPYRELLVDYAMRLELAKTQKMGRESSIVDLDAQGLAQEIKSLKSKAKELESMKGTQEKDNLEAAVKADNKLYKVINNNKDFQELQQNIEAKKVKLAEHHVNLKKAHEALNQQGIAEERLVTASKEYDSFVAKWKEQPGVSVSTPRGRVIEFVESALKKEGSTLTDADGASLLQQSLYTKLPDGRVIARGTYITDKGQQKIDTITHNAKARALKYESLYETEILSLRSGLNYDEMNQINKIRKTESKDAYYIFDNESEFLNAEDVTGIKILTKELASQIDFGVNTDRVMKVVKTEKEYPREIGLSTVGDLKLSISRKVKNEREAASQIVGSIKKKVEGIIPEKIKPVAVDVYAPEGINYSVARGKRNVKFEYDEVSQNWISIEQGRAFGTTPGKLTRQKISSSWGQRENREISRMIAHSTEFDIMGEIRGGTRTYTIYENIPTTLETPYPRTSQSVKLDVNALPDQQGSELYETMTARMTQKQQDQFDELIAKQYYTFIAKNQGKAMTGKQIGAQPKIWNVGRDLIGKIDPSLFRTRTAVERKTRSKKSKAVYDVEDQEVVRQFPKQMDISVAEKKGIIDAEEAYKAVMGMSDTPSKRDMIFAQFRKMRGKDTEEQVQDLGKYEFGADADDFQNAVLKLLTDDGTVPIKEIRKKDPQLVEGNTLKGTRPGSISNLKMRMLEEKSPSRLTLDNTNPQDIPKYEAELLKIREDLIDKKVQTHLNDFTLDERSRAGKYSVDANRESPANYASVKYTSHEMLAIVNDRDSQFIGPLKPKSTDFTARELSDSLTRLKKKGIVQESIEPSSRKEIKRITSTIDAHKQNLTAAQKKIEALKKSKDMKSLQKQIDDNQKQVDAIDKNLIQLRRSEQTVTVKNDILQQTQLRSEKVQVIEFLKSQGLGGDIASQASIVQDAKASIRQLEKQRANLSSKHSFQLKNNEMPTIPYGDEWIGYQKQNMPLLLTSNDPASFVMHNRKDMYEIEQLTREHNRLDAFLKGEGSIAGKKGDDMNVLKAESKTKSAEDELSPFQQDAGPLTREVTVTRNIDGKPEDVTFEVNVIDTQYGKKVDYLSLERAYFQIDVKMKKEEVDQYNNIKFADGGKKNEKKHLSVEEMISLEDEILRETSDASVYSGVGIGRPGKATEENLFKTMRGTRPQPTSATKIMQDAQTYVRTKYGIGKKITSGTPTNRANQAQNLAQAKKSQKTHQYEMDQLKKDMDAHKASKPFGPETKESKAEYYRLESAYKDSESWKNQNTERIKGLERQIQKDYDLDTKARNAGIKALDVQTQKTVTQDTGVPGLPQQFGVPTTNILQAAYAEQEKQKLPTGVKPIQTTPNVMAGITQGFESMTKPAFAAAPQTSFAAAQLDRFTGKLGQQTTSAFEQATSTGQKLLPDALTMIIGKQSVRNRLREDERLLTAPVNLEFLQARQRNYQAMPPIAPLRPLARNVPITPGFIGPYWEDPQDRFLRTKRKKTKSKKIYWEVPEYWFQSGYWGGKDQMGPGYRVFKGKEPKRIRRKDKRKNLD